MRRATWSLTAFQPLAIQCVPALLLMFGIWILPESPQHLVNIGQDQKALEVLAYIRKRSIDDEYVLGFSYLYRTHHEIDPPFQTH